MRKPAFCLAELKDGTILSLSKSGISSVQQFSVSVQPGLCRTSSETPKQVFS